MSPDGVTDTKADAPHILKRSGQLCFGSIMPTSSASSQLLKAADIIDS